jgi:hypothetical protein
VSRLRIYLAFSLLVFASLGLAVMRPYGFQKLNTVVPADGFEALQPAASPVDIADIIGTAPFQPGSAITVDPAEKYRLTVEQGTGNCSERAFGLAWKLRRSDIDLQIVHLLSKQNFAKGQGHSVLRIPYTDRGEMRVGLVDLLEGGLPTNADEPLDIDDLTRGPIENFKLRSLTPLQDEDAPYYGEYLNGVAIGFVPAREIDRYFEFIEWVYVPLGDDRFEKIFYDGLALIAGVLPKVYVPEYENLIREHRVEMWFQNAALWIQRFFFLAFPVILIFEATLWFRSGDRSGEKVGLTDG